MHTCFLFVGHEFEQHYLSLRLDASGHVDAPIERRTVEEFHLIQKGAQTIVVLPTRLASLHQLALPKLSSSKIRAVIPYALEEQLAESVVRLHFAFRRQLDMDNHFLVAVLDKQWLAELLNHLASQQIVFEDMTLDWFAIKEGEACVHDHQVLIHASTFKGAVGVELIDYSLQEMPMPLKIYTFSNGIPIPHHDAVLMPENSYHWIAQRLLTQSFLNICQGEFSQDSKQRKTRRWFMFAGLAAMTWFLVNLLLKIILLFMLKHHNAQVSTQISDLYHQFFPQSHAVVSPRFRIEQLLKQQSGADALLWRLLEQLAAAAFTDGGATADKALRIQALRYQSNGLMLNLECDDFATLEAFESRLHHQGITVRQLSAAQKGKNVVASLELK